MNFKTKLNTGVFVLIFLSPFVLRAQDCKTTTYLESQTVKPGDIVSVNAGTIINPPGKQFIVEANGNATLQAANRIELNYGFKAVAGSVLRAIMVPCDPDSPPKDPVVVFPNPTDGVFTVKASYKINALRLSSMSGMVEFVKDRIEDTSVTVDISKSKPGYYILEVIVEKDVVEAIRIEKK